MEAYHRDSVMGELILCHQAIAATPYYIEEMSVNIYSLEELSYYISKNVYLIGPELKSRELCRWVEKSLNMEDLAIELRKLSDEQAPLHIFVGHILRSSGYLTEQEIKDICEIIATFENKTEAERGKMRADRLLDRDKPVDAIYEYEALLTSKDKDVEPLRGSISHNLGVAYARLFFFNQAAECFEEGFRRSHQTASLKSMLYAYLCAGNMEAFEGAKIKYQISDSLCESVKNTVHNVSKSAVIKEFSDRLTRLRNDYSNNEQYTRQLHSIVDEWKAGYSRLCRI